MRAGEASRTAEYNALFRTLESQRPVTERQLDDPLARAFLSRPLALVAGVSRLGALHRLVVRVIDGRWPGVRSSVVARTRLIDDTIDAVLDDGLGQMVVLGAGYDTRPSRLPSLRGRTVFEVDHPDTQARKRAVLERAAPNGSAGVRFVPTDFDLGHLDTAMAAAGYRSSVPALFLWEGVTNYLSEPVVDATLRWCAGAAAGSHLVFTYVHRDLFTDPGGFAGADRAQRTIRRQGEPMTFGMLPEDLPGYLADRGLRLESDIGCAEYRQRYYGAAARALRGHEFYRVAHARIP